MRKEGIGTPSEGWMPGMVMSGQFVYLANMPLYLSLWQRSCMMRIEDQTRNTHVLPKHVVSRREASGSYWSQRLSILRSQSLDPFLNTLSAESDPTTALTDNVQNDFMR